MATTNNPKNLIELIKKRTLLITSIATAAVTIGFCWGATYEYSFNNIDNDFWGNIYVNIAINLFSSLVFFGLFYLYEKEKERWANDEVVISAGNVKIPGVKQDKDIYLSTSYFSFLELDDADKIETDKQKVVKPAPFWVDTFLKLFGLIKRFQAGSDNNRNFINITETPQKNNRQEVEVEFMQDIEKIKNTIDNENYTVLLRLPLEEINTITSGPMSKYANDAFKKIRRCKKFILVLPKLPGPFNQRLGSLFIETGFAISQSIPVTCYAQKGTYVPKFLRDLNQTHHYQTIRYLNINALCKRLGSRNSIKNDFKIIEAQ